MKAATRALALLAMLTGCSTVLPPDGQAAAHVVNYRCADGRTVQASYPNRDSALVMLEGQWHTLHRARSASGARYVGDGWQGWTRGMHESLLAPAESVASTANVSGHAL